MRLAITGGGTGGHVFPALEVARVAQEAGAEVVYLGSLRGQEAKLAELAGLRFQGFPSEPLYSLKAPRGWKALLNLLRSRAMAGSVLRKLDPDAVFSTGGYAAGPIVSAAHGRGIPVVIHEQNSVPGRSNLMFARKAFAIGLTFRASVEHFEGCRVVRTGFPVRRELRELAAGPREQDLLPHILAVGGSQGAKAINEAALGAAQRMVKRALHWTHVAGKAHFEEVFASFEKLALKDDYEVKSFLDGAAMGEAYGRATLVVGRGGAGTLAELAAFRLPSVLVPYPHAFANHQHHNAMEFAKMGAATFLAQTSLHPSSLEAAIAGWLDAAIRREQAANALENWDAPDAAENLFELVKEAVEAN